MTSEAYRTLSNALDIALSRPASHWVSEKMSAPVTLEGEDWSAPSSAHVSQESAADVPAAATEPLAKPETMAETPRDLSQITHVEGSNGHPRPIAEPSQEMPRFLRDTLDLEDATASLRLLLLNSALDTQRTDPQPDPQLAPTQTVPEKRQFKYWPEAALTTAALVCLGIFFWLDRGPGSLTSSEFSNSKRSGTVSRLNFVGMGSCIGKACETLVTVKSIPAAELSQQQNSGYSVAASPLATANETRGEGVSAGAVAPAPAGIIVSTAGGEIPSQSETAASEPAMMDQAIRIGMPEQAEAASPTETGDSLPQVTHNLEAEPLPDPATPAGTPANPDVKLQTPAPAKARNAGKPKDPRRQGVAQPAQKPAAKAAKPAAPKRGLAEAVPEKTPPAQKAVPASKPSAPVVATTKPPEDIAQSAQGDPAPGFQILNNLNNEFFSFQP